MQLTRLRCISCGGWLKIQGDACYCHTCGAEYLVKKAEEYAETVRRIFGEALAEQKEEQIANCRKNLWEASCAQQVSSKEVIYYARELKNLLSDDFQANFYEVACLGTPKQINNFLNGVDVVENGVYLKQIVDFMVRSMESANVLPLKDLITRGLKGEEYTKHITKVEDEAAKLKDGIYSPQVPRDVFIAYSSRDGKAVNKLVEFLEENKISCFVALRNLRHGRGAMENYINNLKTAMHNCKCVVFLSSENSRDLGCDALKIELPYIRDNEPNMGRIEYLMSEYGENTSYAAKRILESFFKGLEYCRTKGDLIDRILQYITGDMSSATLVAPVAEVTVEAIRKELVVADDERKADERAVEIAELKKRKNLLARVVAPCLAVIIALSVFLGFWVADQNKRFIYKLNNDGNSYSISYVGDTYFNKNEITIPSKYQGKPVTQICAYAFSESSNLTKITIPGNIAYIGHNAFKDCTAEIIWRDNSTIIEIGTYVFASYKGTSIEIPDSVTSIEAMAFVDCQKLESIIIPDSVISINFNVFSGCINLKTIYCEADSKPQNWNKDWLSNCNAEVVWGYKG